MKRRRDTQDEAGATKKQSVDYATFQKWQHDLDHEYQMMSWVYCSSEKEHGKKVTVTQLKCKVCSEFVERIQGQKTSATNGSSGSTV